MVAVSAGDCFSIRQEEEEDHWTLKDLTGDFVGVSFYGVSPIEALFPCIIAAVLTAGTEALT